MPKLKQPPPLLKMATDRLVYSLAKRCNDCSIEGSLDELRQVVAFIKAEIFPKIPWCMGADFVESFTSRYSDGFKPRQDRPESHERAVLEVIMDRKIVGLRLSVSSAVSGSMNSEDAHRIRGISKLIVKLISGSTLRNLKTFNLEDLEKFVCEYQCTDDYLQIIGENCPKLDRLSISLSEQVTDKGLVALNKCTELRIANFWGCRNITNRGIQEFLEAHEKIEKIDFNFKCYSDEGWSVYPSITHYTVYLEYITNSNLRLIAEKFPNLTTLHIYGEIDDSECLSTLGSLKKLTDLRFRPIGDVFVWDALKPLLRIIGVNITGLHTCTPGCGTIASSITQADLDFLHKFCPNIESLSFDYDAEEDGQILVIPPFGRLRELNCFNSSDHPDYVRLQFGVMRNLKTLHIMNVNTTTEMLESMVLDNDNFPVLNYIGISEVPMGCDLDRIKEIVRNNNIDLRFNC